jgi:hypothetical protein
MYINFETFFQNPEFHRTVEELTSWLEATTASIRSSEPVDLRVDPSILEQKLEKFRELHSGNNTYIN